MLRSRARENNAKKKIISWYRTVILRKRRGKRRLKVILKAGIRKWLEVEEKKKKKAKYDFKFRAFTQCLEIYYIISLNSHNNLAREYNAIFHKGK